MGYVSRFVNNLKCSLRKDKESMVSDEIPTIQENEGALKKLIAEDQHLIKQNNAFEKIRNSLQLFEDKNGF